MDAPARKPIAKIVTRKNFFCPECNVSLPDDLFESGPFLEAECPECKKIISLPAAQKGLVEHENERREQRCPIALQIKYGSGREFKLDYTRNVSQGGMFIRTDDPPGLGTKIQLELHIPELSEPVLLYGEVVHSHKYSASNEEAGIGVRFLDIDPISRGILMNYLKSLSDCS